MLALAVDTATPAVTAGLVELEQAAAGANTSDAAPRTLAARVLVDARAHAEALTPQILECLAEAGVSRAEIGAVVTGIGPGPFTGLRVGMATAAAFGDALGIPVHGVCSLDAVAVECAPELGPDDELLVVTDARRREVYAARYRDRGRIRVAGPEVCEPGDLPVAGATKIAGSAAHTALFALPALSVQTPSPAALVQVAAGALWSGVTPEPLIPLYLRRPDAVERSYRTLDRMGA
ncbi:tRNA (adenosine(37)-N6)-threonylcarbamoyltransferase complex dimerization subunit type 1 TsaB [Nocardia grenadensis]|uniref:tRNA (adenosine(37)-N6)-threonylcarbamoyltransferase complex dimerization subunit type 1 TsaB n=1 Tax=Nocardia grenadensis TaxID=931537 RepID=UPI0007A49DD4|nr:tRNA (adenosine(37)-N6)-threonylcarbamoyltransferase complex dimerization subunit type 1 TsaB [Nocardia grenadensis]